MNSCSEYALSDISSPSKEDLDIIGLKEQTHARDLVSHPSRPMYLSAGHDGKVLIPSKNMDFC